MSSANRDLNSRPSVRSSVFLHPIISNQLLQLQTAMSTGEENDLVKAVDNLLNNLGPKFSKVSAELFAKSIRQYGRRELGHGLKIYSGRDVPTAR